MAPINRVEVVIDKVIYELASHEPIEYIQSVANYVDKKIKNLYSSRSEAATNPRFKILFLSLNIAYDLFKERDKVKELELLSSKLEKEVAGYREENAALKKDCKDMKAELKTLNANFVKLKAELDERTEEEEDLRRDKKLASIVSNVNGNVKQQ